MKCTAAAVVGIVATATLVASVCVSLFLARLPALLDRALLLDDGFCTRLAEYDKGNSTGKIIRVDYVEKDRHRVALGAEAASPGRGTQRSHYDGLTGLTKRVRDSALGLTRCISGGRSIRTVRSMIRRLAPSSAKKGPCTRYVTSIESSGLD